MKRELLTASVAMIIFIIPQYNLMAGGSGELLERGIGLHEQGRPEEARTLLEMSLEEEGDVPAAYYLGRISLERGDRETAEGHLEEEDRRERLISG